MPLKKKLYNLLYRIEPNSRVLYRLSKLYADRYRGENNRDKNSNGEFQYLRKTLPNCATAVDAGAFQGDWATEALEINPSLQIHCFEPSSANFQLLKKNLSERVLANHCGLSDRKQQADFFPFSRVGQASSLYQRVGSPKELGQQLVAEQVQLVTLDEYAIEMSLDSIDFLKVDVEGHELAVLKGASRLFSEKRVKFVQFEYSSANIHSRVFFKDILEFFTKHDYRVRKLFRRGPKDILEYDQSLDNFQYANYVAERGSVKS